MAEHSWADGGVRDLERAHVERGEAAVEGEGYLLAQDGSCCDDGGGQERYRHSHHRCRSDLEARLDNNSGVERGRDGGEEPGAHDKEARLVEPLPADVLSEL
jgi:hypothetical protein